MSRIIEIPEVIASKAAELGIDIEREVLEYIIKRLGLDPKAEVEVHLNLAKKFLEEGRKLVDKDPIQASEKLYKAAEEAIKALAIHLNLSNILSRVTARGRWTIADMEKTVRILKKKIGKIMMEAWDTAWYLHVLGFHEAKLDSEGVKERIEPIEALIKVAQEICGSSGFSGSFDR